MTDDTRKPVEADYHLSVDAEIDVERLEQALSSAAVEVLCDEHGWVEWPHDCEADQ